MNTSSPTTRFLLVPLLVLGLIAGGWAMSGDSAQVVFGGVGVAKCCQQVVAACCGMPCCQAPPPVAPSFPADESRPTDDGTGNARLPGVPAVDGRFAVAGDPVRQGRSLAVPISGSPSLITLHVCLRW